MKQDIFMDQFNQIVSDYEKFRLIKNEEEKTSEYRKFKFAFSQSMNFIGISSKDILEKTYFKVNYKFWWTSIYSKTTYYRLRKTAIEDFVKVFEKFNAIFEEVHFADYKFEHYELALA